VGLVASRLTDKYYRPAIIIKQGAAESHGSCRSITEVDITQCLDQVADLLVRHGGHAKAAGLTIRNENLPEFQARMNDIIASQLDGQDLRPTLNIDVEIPLRDVDWALHGVLEQLEPTGYANATPIFASRDVQVLNYRAVGQDGTHLQLTLGDGFHGWRAIAFRQGEWVNQIPRKVDVVYTIGVNEWQGRRDLQLIVQDIRPALRKDSALPG